MTQQNANPVPSQRPEDRLTLNFNRGLKGMAEKLIQRFPHGQKVLDGGLREVINRAIDQNPEISKQDFTAVELAERIGILKRSNEHFRQRRRERKRRA